MKQTKQFFSLSIGRAGVGLLLMAIVMMVMPAKIWADQDLSAHFYLIGTMTGDNWSENQTSRAINTSYNGEAGKYSIEVSVIPGTEYSFALYNGSNQYGPTTNNILPGNAGGYNTNAWKYKAESAKIRVCVDESSDQVNNNGLYPYVWVEEIGGIGVDSNPYKISTAAELIAYRDLINACVGNYRIRYYELTDDIDLSTICHEKDETNGVEEASWTPIGIAEWPFMGIFNGKGHSITGLYIHYTTGQQGLFGYINGATVRNLTVSGKMESTVSSTKGSVDKIGGVIGWAYNSTVEDITSSVDFKLGSETETTAQGHVGGVVGSCDGTTISGCLYKGTLNAGASGDCVGGITGYFRCDNKTTEAFQITNCHNAGSVTTSSESHAVAGILGYLNDSKFMGIHNCLNTGKITTGSATMGGAIYGLYKNTSNIGSNNYYKAGTASKGVSSVAESSQKPESVCTAVTEDQLTKGEVCYLLNGKKCTGTPAWYQKLPSTGSGQVSTPSDATPVLKSTGDNTVYYGYSGHTLTYANSALSDRPEHNFVDGICSCGTFENEPVKVTSLNAETLGLDASYVDYYAIANATELKWFANVVNNENDTYKNAKVVLTADIDLSTVCHAANAENAEVNWSPIGSPDHPFKGTFDGNNHNITGLYINYNSFYQGLFGFIDSGTLKNFSVSGEMKSSTYVSRVGGVVGCTNGSSTNTSVIKCVTNNVNITVAPGITQEHVAGIAGVACNVTITNCVNNGNIDAGATIAEKAVGGIAGNVSGCGKIMYCLNTGNVTSSSDAYLGGILGYINSDTFSGVQYCLNTGTISQNSHHSAIIGYTREGIGNKSDLYHSNYYLSTSAARGYAQAGSALKEYTATAVTVDELSKGKVCYLLNGEQSTGSLAWYQNIGTDNIPVLSSNHQVVYNDGGSYNNPYTVTAGTAGYGDKEAIGKAFDRSTDTKWCCTSGSGTNIYVEFNTSNAMKVGSYTFTTAGDAKDYSVRNPKTWILKGKVNSTDANWTTIDTQTNSSKMPATNNTAVTFYLDAATATAYKYFRIDFTHAQSTSFQLSEITLSSAVHEHSYDAYHYCSKCGNYDATYVKASGSDGTCRWAIFNNADANYSDGEMVVYPSSGTSGTLANWINYYDAGWYNSRKLIKTVRFAGNITAKTMSRMFRECENLVSVNFTNLNTDNVKSMWQMFYQCKSLENPNLNTINTTKVTDMRELFYYCINLSSLDLSSLKTSQVTQMNQIFCWCSNLQSLTLGNFDMQNVTSTTSMFDATSNLKNLTLKAVPYLKDQTINSKFTGNGVTVNYQLDDNSVVYIPTAEKANYLPVATVAPTYTRTIAADSNWGTAVIPFEAKSDANVQLYALTAVGDGKVTLSPVATVAANTPCVFKKKTADATSVIFTANSIAAPAAATPATPAAIGGLTLTGTYSATKVAAEAGYVLNADQIVKTSAETAVAPFQAYLAGSIDAVDALTINVLNGDFNADGQITVSDLTRLVEILNGRATDTNGAADVDMDGDVDIDDVDALSNKVLGK